jgi:hypothetical protein
VQVPGVVAHEHVLHVRPSWMLPKIKVGFV